MHRFNKYKYLHKIHDKNNKKTKILSIVISVVVLVGAIIYFSFARFESIQNFNLINGTANIPSEARLLSGIKLNKMLKQLAGDEPTQELIDSFNDPNVSIGYGVDGSTEYDIYNYIDDESIIHISFADHEPEISDNAVVISTSDSFRKAYAWYNDGNVYIYSNAERIYLNSDSSFLFHKLTKATLLDLSHFDSSNVESMQGMFSGMNTIRTLDLSSFDTSNTVNMSYMFFDMNSLGYYGSNSFNFGTFDVSKVTNMSNMFSGLERLNSLDLSNWDTSNVTDMSNMFYRCRILNGLDLSNWNTSKVTNMSNMFLGLNGLYSLDLSNWDTSNVTNMSSMFEAVSNIMTLDISSFDTSKVTNMSRMFYYVSGVRTIYVGNGWTTSVVIGGTLIFNDNGKLKGGAGTKFSSDHVDLSYAHVDGGRPNPGYFTLKTN